MMKIALASDHAGFAYKQEIARHLRGAGHQVVDFGTDSEESVDYPLFIGPAAAAVAAGECERGIVLGGSGNGEAMAANRHRGVRCALCWSTESARLARQHNDANMISFGQRLLPVGTLYDPFINRGLDALNYACYQDARFMLVATPSGITLAPEGGAHQSIHTPLIGMAQDKLAYFEPAFVDELATIMRWGFDHMQQPDGGSVYLRLSTRPIDQPDRAPTPDWTDAVLNGAYWLVPPAEGASLAIAYTGAVAAEAIEAHRALVEDVPGAGLLAVTSADRLHADWSAAVRDLGRAARRRDSHIAALLAPLSPGAGLVTVIDGAPATLSWLGAVCGHRVMPLGVDRFGQSGDVPDLYDAYRIGTDAILDACASVFSSMA